MKIYECGLCNKFVKSGIKGYSIFKGTRKCIRKHLVDVHGIKGKQKNVNGKNLQSDLTKNTIVREFL